MYKKTLNLFLLILLIFSLTACTLTKLDLSSNESLIFAKKNGTFQSLLVEKAELTLDENKLNELKKFIEDEIANFTKQENKNVKLLKVASESNYIKALFEYSNFEDLLAYSKYSKDDSINIKDIKILDAKDEISKTYLEKITTPKQVKKIMLVEGSALLKVDYDIIDFKSSKQTQVEILDKNTIKIKSNENDKDDEIIKTIIFMN